MEVHSLVPRPSTNSVTQGLPIVHDFELSTTGSGNYELHIYSLHPMQVLAGMMYKIYYIDSLVEGFSTHFNKHYADALATDFNSLSLQEQVNYVRLLYEVSHTLRAWLPDRTNFRNYR